MKIFSTEPNTWQDLQNFVCQMFKECNFDVEVSKIVKLGRGKKEIDVCVQDNSSEHELKILVE